MALSPIDDDITDVDPTFEVEEQEDGSALINMTGEDDDDLDPEDPDFGENLAESFPSTFITSLGTDQAELIESDRTSREPRDKQQAEGIKRTGLGKDAPGGATFEGSSKAVHPMLAKGCVDFASRAIKELFPSTGPCKTQIIGESDDAKLDKAERKKTYMNWQLTTRIGEQRAEFERLLSQLPLGGSQYKRWWWDAELGRPRTETVFIDDVFLPYSQSDFYTSYRVTHRQWVARDEYDKRIASGLYRDLNISAPTPGWSDKSQSKVASDKVEGVEEDDSAYNDEGLREIYMAYVDLALEDDPLTKGRIAPYIIHIENDTQKVLGLYRNWAHDDDKFAKKHWMVEYTFIPWRGGPGVGLFHLIGSLSAAGTGSLRALMDSAMIQNFPGGLKLKGGRTAGQSIQVNATELAEIDAPAGVDDIRKMVMPFPFAGPSPVLFNLLEWLTQQAEGVISTASEAISQAGNNMPVGTALALIEHGSVNFSAIHARCHASLKKELEILHRLDAENMTDDETVEELGSLVVTRQDFQGPLDIIPVSDPNIFSEAQRYAQLQAVMQLAANPAFVQFFKPDRLLQRSLRLLQIPSPDDLANLPKDPKRMGPLDETYLVCSPEPAPLKVYSEQDDVAHLETHLHFLVSPMFGANPLIGAQAFGPLMVHIKDHMMSFYKKHTRGAADALLTLSPVLGGDLTQVQAEAKGAAFADQVMAQLLGPMIMPAMQQAQQLAAQFAPKPPVDPTVQAQIAGQAAIAQANNAAQMELAKNQALQRSQDEEKALQFKAAEQQRALEAKMANDEEERMFKKWQEETKQDANDRATAMATSIEQHALETQRQLAEFNAAQLQQRETEAARAETYRMQLKADNDAQFLVLQTLIQQSAAPQVPDVAGIIQPIIADMQANSSAMMEQLAQGLSGLHAAHSAPRVARYIKDEMGNNIGVESIIKGTTK
jgi:hypothetical protein